MNEDKLFRLCRELIDIDSTTETEAAVVQYVGDYLRRQGHYDVELWDVPSSVPGGSGRRNIFALPKRARPHPNVVLSTHLDCVPPFFPSREDTDFIYGRGACDAKGICAAQIFAAAELITAGDDQFGLLFVVGEERNSAGAMVANERPQGSRFLVNGEPTESRIVTAGKGALRLDLRAHGRAAHSAYPELGDSAIDKLLDAIARLRSLPLPSHPQLGPTTINVGTLAGGRAPNVVADEARAELLIRLVVDAAPLRAQISAAVGSLVEAEFVLEIPPVSFQTVPGFPTGIVAYGTDVPKLDRWGTPVLFGPGSIQVAHTPRERIAKRELCAAVGAYTQIVRHLLSTPGDGRGTPLG